MKSAAAMRVQKHRENLRKKGLKPLQIWVPDTHQQSFADTCRSQALLANQSHEEQRTLDFINKTADLRDWE